MPLISCLVRVFAAGLIVVLAHETTAAQDGAGFYRGKTIHLTVGGLPGSDDDIYGRLIAKYLGRHIVGNPAVAASDMPGDGGHIAAGYIYSAAAKDGTAIGAVPAEVITAPLWFGFGTVPHDPTKFIYLGSAAAENTDCFVGGDTPVKTLRDAFVGEVTVGAMIDGGPTRDGPVLLNALLGTKFRVVAKYAGIGEILAAIGKGEVAGACGLSWSSVSNRHPDWLAKGELRGLVQESVAGAPLATRMGIPRAIDYVASAADGEILALAYAQQAFGRPFILPPETPAAQTAALRAAFMATLQDNDLLAEAKVAHVEIDPVSGQSIAAQVAKLYATPPQMAERVRAALGSGPAR